MSVTPRAVFCGLGRLAVNEYAWALRSAQYGRHDAARLSHAAASAWLTAMQWLVGAAFLPGSGAI